MSLDEELRQLDVKLGRLKLDYEQYFLGSRPREPVQLRGEVQKAVIAFTQTPIQNTADRFRFNALNSRFQAFKRQWNNVLRQMEAGTYKRHVFKADLRSRDRAESSESKPSTPVPQRTGQDLFAAYRDAAEACGQNTQSLTPEKLQRVIRKQESALREKLGCSRVDFRVAVQDGKVKLKATPVRD